MSPMPRRYAPDFDADYDEERDGPIDWRALRAAAIDAMHGAYAPYSRFPVGAAALVSDGRIIRGANVENASYGLTLCAECGVVSALYATGGGRLVALACVDADGTALMPCGRCRQLLWEHGGPELLILSAEDPYRMADLLPRAFGDADLDRVAGRLDPKEPVGATVEPPPHVRDRLGQGTVVVHPDSDQGVRVWTAYWDGASGADGPQILDEAPTRPDAADLIAWGRARTRRVVVVDADGQMYWAGEGPAPADVTKPWAQP